MSSLRHLASCWYQFSSYAARGRRHSSFCESQGSFAGSLEDELLRFPTATHDDQVDALSLLGQLLDHIRVPVAKKPETKPTAAGYSAHRTAKASDVLVM